MIQISAIPDARRSFLAHRVSWELANGPIPSGMCVLHRCDNPPCVNPVHLFLGTQHDNVIDMIAKGRKNPACGENHGRAKLTAAAVREIRERGLTESQQSLARLHGVSQVAISHVLLRKSWKHLAR